MAGKAHGEMCDKHPQLEGLRYLPAWTCVGCTKENSKRLYRERTVETPKKIVRLTAERDALQQRLTAADERADLLEGQLAESERKRREFVAAVKVETDQIEAKHSRCIVVPEGYAVVPIKPTKAMRDACQIAGKLPVWDAMMAAALKPAEAARCANCDRTTVEQCDDAGCGFLGAGNGAPE